MANNVTNDNSDVDCGFKDMLETYANDYHPYLAIVVCLFGTVANILNIAVLTRKDMVCAPINRILTALAIADMVLMIEYIPYACYYYMVVPTKMDFPYPGGVYMLFHAHITQILHTIYLDLKWKQILAAASDNTKQVPMFINFHVPWNIAEN
jgi:hypothetical protein